LGSGDVAVQPTLVSGTNIKTLNSVSLLGAGDIVLNVSPSGVAGAIQFSDGSAFASDAANLFWDDTNNRLGVGTNAPTNTFEIASTSTSPFKVATTAGYFRSSYKAGAITGLFDFVEGAGFSFPTDNVIFGSSSSLGARVGIKGSGSTSATTSLLVQNSSGTERLRVYDNGDLLMGGTNGSIGVFQADSNYYKSNDLHYFQSGSYIQAAIRGASDAGVGMQLGKGASAANASSILELVSTQKGFLPPRMTTTQKNAIATPAAGLVVYDSTTNKLQCYNGSTWNDLF
jgi:hypothetical protein